MILIPTYEHEPLTLFEESICGLLSRQDSYRHIMPGKEDSDSFCYQIEKKENGYEVRSSYYVGVDWVNDDVAIRVRPKMDGATGSIDYLKMLTDALQEPENIEHLDGLLSIDFNAKPIPLVEREDMLSPFIVAQFLLSLKRAVRKGLKNSYYLVSDNLSSKIKGRVLVAKTISKNLSTGDKISYYCQFQEYGINSEENKILKRALALSSEILTSYRGGMDVSTLKKTISLIYPFFRGVTDDYDLNKESSYKPNPIFRDYYDALKFGILILKRKSFGFQRYSSSFDSTPPYWIDMSKLFELYVFQALRKVYKNPGEVQYHFHTRGLELDYLLKPVVGTPMVIDAKYKPRYHYEGVDLDDIRQVSAYARMESVYKKLNVPDDKLIDCLIVYANQDCPSSFPDSFDRLEISKVSGYSKFRKIGISLPMKH